VTSCDSGSLVMGILTCGGETDIRVPERMFRAILAGVVAAVLVFVAVCLVKALREDLPSRFSP
jgi:choline-glycine betaine transporter